MTILNLNQSGVSVQIGMRLWKKLAMTLIVAALMALSALATLLLANGAAARVGCPGCASLKTVPTLAYAHAAGTDLYCQSIYDKAGAPSFGCFVTKTGLPAAKTYLAVINDSGVTVEKVDATGTGYTFIKVFSNS